MLSFQRACLDIIAATFVYLYNTSYNISFVKFEKSHKPPDSFGLHHWLTKAEHHHARPLFYILPSSIKAPDQKFRVILHIERRKWTGALKFNMFLIEDVTGVECLSITENKENSPWISMQNCFSDGGNDLRRPPKQARRGKIQVLRNSRSSFRRPQSWTGPGVGTKSPPPLNKNAFFRFTNAAQSLAVCSIH